MTVASIDPRLFLTTAKRRWLDLLTWIAYNVFIGTAFLWLQWLFIFIAQSPTAKWTTNLLNGSLGVFVMTLCSSQAALFAEMTGQRFLRMNKFLLAVFLLIIIFDGFFAAVLSTGTAAPVHEGRVLALTAVLFLLAVLLCLVLYIARLCSETDISQDATERQKQLATEARTSDDVDGIRI